MEVEANEYHPYAACLIFKGSRNSGYVRASLAEISRQALTAAAAAAFDVCSGRQSMDDAGSSRWLEAGKCARQSRDAILALIPNHQSKEE